MTDQEEVELLKHLEDEDRSACEDSLYYFIRAAWHVVEPGKEFYDNWHIEAICEHLEATVTGDIKRLIINIPPRHMKSTICAVMFPVWVWIKDPSKQFLFSSYARDLSVRDSVKCRRLMQSTWFQSKWGEQFTLTGDQNTKLRFDNDRNGYRLATSVDGATTGEGGDLIVVDDPHNVKQAESDVVRTSVTEDWWDGAMQTRLNNFNTGVFIIIMQRVHENDLCGHILKNDAVNDWAHLCLPARYEADHPTLSNTPLGFTDPRTEEGELLWPERMGESTLSNLESSMGRYAVAGQMQQRPSPKGGGILKASDWRVWEYEDKDGDIAWPPFEYVIQSYDTGFSTKDDASYSARTEWGVFKHHGQSHAMLLGMWRSRVSYPDLRREAKEAYVRQRPDVVLIEKKASGQSLIQDLRQMGIPVVEYMPDRDKVARAHAGSALLEMGLIWRPQRRWANDLVELCAVFPAGDGADVVDTCTQAWIRLRNMWFLVREDDGIEDEDDSVYTDSTKRALYG
mgnify:FL=1